MKSPSKLGPLVGVVALLASAGCAERAASADAHEGEHEQAHAASPSGTSPAGPPNPVQNEMRLLSAAMEATVRAIGSGDLRGVPHELHRVHAARQATEAALQSGRYRPAKNGDRIDRFVELDRAFHGHLEALVHSSAANDVPRAAAAFGAAMQSCQGCHQEFRR